MARWINVSSPFNYHWPNRSAVTHFSASDLGDHYVKDEVADFAIGNGYACEGKADPASKSVKGKRIRTREPKPEQTADPRAEPPMDHESDADADRSADRPALDSDAE